MLSNVHDDLIGEYEGYLTTKEMWDQLAKQLESFLERLFELLNR